MYDGYGSTEAGSIATDNVVAQGVEIRLEDAPELGYTSADKPNPRGEVLVKSSNVSAACHIIIIISTYFGRLGIVQTPHAAIQMLFLF